MISPNSIELAIDLRLRRIVIRPYCPPEYDDATCLYVICPYIVKKTSQALETCEVLTVLLTRLSAGSGNSR